MRGIKLPPLRLEYACYLTRMEHKLREFYFKQLSLLPVLTEL